MRFHRALLYAMAGQAGWSVCVLSVAHDAAWIGIAFVAVLLVLHLQQTRQSQRELRLVVRVVALAAPWGALPIRVGLIAYPRGTLQAGFASLWLLVLWMLFAIQVNVPFCWLCDRWWLVLALGIVVGPFSFRTSATLGAAHVSMTTATLGTLAVGWAIWMPLLARMDEHNDGTGTPS